MKAQKLKYFGHISRHECLERTMIEGRIGRLCRHSWRDDVVVERLQVDIGIAKRATI